MKKPKTARLVWGIILAAFGLFRLSEISTAENKPGFAVTCILFMIGGGLLIFFYVRAMGRYRTCPGADTDQGFRRSDAMKIDIEALRRDMIEECEEAAFGADIDEAILDAFDIERMDADELMETARRYGFNLKHYRV